MRKIQLASDFVEARNNHQTIDLAIILGSGLGPLADQIESAIRIDYSEIPQFPISTVPGHAGRLVIGELSGKRVLAFQGRVHYYEGYNMKEVTFPIRLAQTLGVKKLLVTNAAGGIQEGMEPGDLMVIEDHLNLMGTNPLIGANKDDLGPRFPDMSQAYSVDLSQLLKEEGEKLGLSLKSGVYAGLTGPSYETPAEIRALRAIGADAVGMSTVPEVIVAKHGGMEVAGISCISNLAAGSQVDLNHDEVVAVTQRVALDFQALIKAFITRL